uniref:Glycosyltransferase family 92 protein n=1 Tax=Amphilophus citrinellus TaxID=61819 RepID=A0A3Q0SM81_AMPCI
MKAKQTITPLSNTKHLLVSAYMDQRLEDLDIHIIGIFRRDSIQPLNCFFCCKDYLGKTTPTYNIQITLVFPSSLQMLCVRFLRPAMLHVTLLTKPENETAFDYTWLPIRNKKTDGQDKEKIQFDFTVCISNLFGDYNNMLQFAQTLEMYSRVVICNTSCGPDLDCLLQSYSQEGFVEIVPWPIGKHLIPSHGWHVSQFGEDLHYFGQQTILNECIYRSMERSRYVLLNDIDEIIMPYQHNDLMSLMNMLQKQHPNCPHVRRVFLENHIFPKKHFEPCGRFHLLQWNGVPGVNILEHIYREDPDRTKYHPHKMIVQPGGHVKQLLPKNKRKSWCTGPTVAKLAETLECVCCSHSLDSL